MRMRQVKKLEIPSVEIQNEVLPIAGGRLAYLNRIARAYDMREVARHLLAVEKGWLQSQIGLIPDCDDDVMDEVGDPLFRLRLHT